jgi:DNA-binding beta-propeller fold protein YncE
LISVTRATFTLADGASASAPPIALPCADAADSYLYVADLLANGNDLFALCSGDPDGYIVQLDANTGAVKGTPQLVGATPVAMALLGDGRIAVVNSIDETLALVTPGGGALSDGGTAGPKVQTKAYTCAQCQSLSDVKARGLFVYLVDSSTNTALKLDLSQTDPAKMLVNEVNTGDNSSPWAILPLDDNQALVSNNGLGALVGVNFSTAADAGTAGDAGSN